MKKISTWMLAAGILAGTLGCDTSTSETPLPDPVVASPIGSWALQSFTRDSGSVIPVPDPEDYTLELAEDGRAHVRADCNICNGPYELSGSTLTFGNMACTVVACLPGSLERDYLQALTSTMSFERAENELTLVHADGALRFQTR